MKIPTEPIGSTPRPPALIDAIERLGAHHPDVDPEVETREVVRDRTLAAARHIPLDRLGTTDDCGFAPLCDDRPTTRDSAFAKIASRVQGTAMAAAKLGMRP